MAEIDVVGHYVVAIHCGCPLMWLSIGPFRVDGKDSVREPSAFSILFLSAMRMILHNLISQMINVDMGIDFCGKDRFVAKHFLDAA